MPDATVTNAADAAVIQQATTGTTPTEFTYEFPDKRVYKAGTEKELLEQVGNRYKELFGHAETLKQENATFRASVAQLATGQQPANTNGYSHEKYLEIWTKNPLEANQYLNAHDPQINAAMKQLEQIQWQNQTGAFLAANPDFPMSETNTAALSKVCDQMFPGQGVVSAAQMKAAHLFCQSEKMYGEGTVTQATTKVIPPVPPAGSSADASGAPDINKMDQAQLRQYIESLAQQQK